MKCNGEVGYFLNLKKEYGNRADMIFKKLEEEKKVQGVFITDFIKIDYINITKILLYMIQNNKVRTYFDGLYIDKEYYNFFYHDNKYKIIHEVEENKNTDKIDKTMTVDNQINSFSNNSEINFKNLNHYKSINGDLKKSVNEDINEYINNDLENNKIEYVNNDSENNKIEYVNNDSENNKIEYINNDTKRYVYKKIEIHKSELLNINDIMNYDGNVENIDKMIYYLNPCSVLSAYFLDIKKNEHVLDMCASPGGKSLVIANILFGYNVSPLNRIDNINTNEKHIEINCCLDIINYYKMNRAGFLVVNEYNKMRYDRLKQVLYKYLPNDLLNSNNVHITNYNGLNLNSFMRFSKFHKILLDVPCSSDGYLMRKNKNDLKKWSINVIKNNSNVQFELLNNSFHLLHSNGVIIYSTCALSYYENDYVIEKLIKKYRNKVKIIDFIEEELQKRYQSFCPNFQKNKNIESCHCIKENTVSNNTNDEKIEYSDKENNYQTFHNNYNQSNQNNFNNNKYTSNNNISNNDNAGNSNNNFTLRNYKDNSCCIHQFSEFKKRNNFLSFLEKTKYGYISLPDKSPFGILYICKIQKI